VKTEADDTKKAVENTVKIALELEKNKVAAEAEIKRIAQEKIDAAKQAEKTKKDAEELEMKAEEAALEAEKAKYSLSKVENVADMPDAQKKADEAARKAKAMLEAQRKIDAAKKKAAADLKRRLERERKARELAKQLALAKAKADAAMAKAKAEMAAKAARMAKMLEEAKRKAAAEREEALRKRDFNRLLVEQTLYNEKKEAEPIEKLAAAFDLELANNYNSENMDSVKKNTDTANSIKKDLTAAIKHADIAYELAKALQIKW
jgi:hypothetical protein